MHLESWFAVFMASILYLTLKKIHFNPEYHATSLRHVTHTCGEVFSKTQICSIGSTLNSLWPTVGSPHCHMERRLPGAPVLLSDHNVILVANTAYTIAHR